MATKRQEAVEARCLDMTDDELRALLVSPHTTTTVWKVAANRLKFRERQRKLQEYERESDRLRGLSEDELWTEATARGRDILSRNRAADEIEWRQKIERRDLQREIERQKAKRIEAERERDEHLTLEQLLAFDPADASREEISGAIEELRRRARLCEDKIKSLAKVSWRAPHRGPMRDITPGRSDTPLLDTDHTED